MKKRKFFLILSTMMFWAYYAQAQFDVKLYITDGIADTVVKSAIEHNGSLLLSEIGKAFLEERTPEFTGIAVSPEASKTILDIWSNTSIMNCSISELNRKCLKRYDGGYQVRDIPILMLDVNIPESDRQQEICINFTAEGSIDEIFISKDAHRIASILTEGMEVQEGRRRQRIQNFVEEFRTAYNTKDWKFLNTVYGNDAIIISGKVIKIIPNSDAAIKVPQERIQYVTQTKEQYMQKLKYIFATVKYINLEFAEIEVQQHPKYHEIYGVVFKQNWNTTYANGDGYKDVGYVFLMMDFKDENNPIIHVRTWQPEKYNGQELKKGEIFRVTSFNINNR
ncbi:MAG: hypothetical protein LBS69_13130 [Prevotellaceae bacterium]|jgi:hypothetical protein|nr:hypothetical protein [Prevotellaceae bacterium]